MVGLTIGAVTVDDTVAYRQQGGELPVCEWLSVNGG